MEGISGVTMWEHVDPVQPEYQRFRHIMTAEVNAAIKGAFDGGADEVIITDGHWNGTNILIEEIDPRVVINSGLGTAPYSMMQGIDSTISGVIFIGYHARASSQNGILDHTWSRKITNVKLNNIVVGEFGLNGALAGHFDVPIIMITGDQTACNQAQELLGNLELVNVKQATGRYSASCLPPEISQKLIIASAHKAVMNLKNGIAPKPYHLTTPIVVSIEFVSSDMADRASRIPGAIRDGVRIEFSAHDMTEAYTNFRAAAGLASLE